MEQSEYKDSAFGRPGRTQGRYGYVAYMARPIPRSIDLPASTVKMLTEAEGALGQLAGAGRLLPNPDLLISPYLLREALSSTRIEGTQASMVEVLESDPELQQVNEDVEEVINYTTAMRIGIERLNALPLSVRLLREIHEVLMDGVRGRERSPGEIRSTQNWIGSSDSTVSTAKFVPPPPDLLADLLSDWERFANEDTELPLLVQDALLHAQFETIHPFLDGNGRLGRLVIVFFLIARKKLPSPLLYVSDYLESNRSSYYQALQAMRESGDPIPWLELFLAGVETQASDALTRAEKMMDIREGYREKASSLRSPNAHQVVELISINPIVSSGRVRRALGVSRPTVLRLLDSFEELGVLSTWRPGARGERRYVATELFEAISRDEPGGSSS
jgi:Fic family protein